MADSPYRSELGIWNTPPGVKGGILGVSPPLAKMPTGVSEARKIFQSIRQRQQLKLPSPDPSNSYFSPPMERPLQLDKFIRNRI